MTADRLIPQDLQKQLKDNSEIAIFQQWKDTESSPVHPLLPKSGQSYFDIQRAEFVPRRPYHDLEQYVEIYRDKKNRPPTWQDALDQAEAAERSYNRHNTERGFGKFMKEKGSSWATDLAPLRVLFPEDHGLNVIAGGLSLIFHGLSKVADNREKIFSFFREVPVIADEATKRHKLLTSNYPPKEVIALNDRLDDLCQSVINGLCGLIHIVQPREKKSLLAKARLSAKASPRLESIFRVDSTADKIDMLIKQVKQSKDMFNECAKTLEAKLSRDNFTVGKESLREIQATRQTVHQGWHDTRTLSEEALREAKMIQRGVDHLTYTVTMDRVERQHTENAFYNILMNTIRSMQLDYETKLASSLQMNTTVRAQKPAITLHQLLELLQVDPRSPGNDLIEASQSSMMIEDEAQQLSGRILNDETFQNWLFAPQSAGILVEELELARNSESDLPFGMFLSMLMASLRMLTRQGHQLRFASCFFCNMHAHPSEILSGPSGMMRSLISQLLLSISEIETTQDAGPTLLDLTFLEEAPRLLEAAANQSVTDLCELYIHLIRHLPHTATVICLIDGVENFETFETPAYNWKAEIHYIVQQLQALARLHDGKCAFKFCITSCGTTYIGDLFAPHESISPGSNHLGASILSEESFVDDLMEADSTFRTPKSIQYASSFDDLRGFNSNTGHLHPHHQERQYGSHSTGSSQVPSYHTVRGSLSNPNLSMKGYY